MRRHVHMDKRFSTIPEPLWRLVAPLLPEEPAKPKGGRPRVADRRVLGGILYRLRTGCQWRAIPDAFGSGPTCHRRFQQWVAAGVFTRTFVQLLKRYDARRGIVWEWSALDSATVKAPKGGSSRARTRRTARSSA
jgi:transposase